MKEPNRVLTDDEIRKASWQHEKDCGSEYCGFGPCVSAIARNVEAAVIERLTLGKHEGAEPPSCNVCASVEHKHHPSSSDSLAQDEAKVAGLLERASLDVDLWCIVQDFAALARRLLKENDELEALFDLQQTRTTEAIALWRAEKPEERRLRSPDLGALLTWLMERGDDRR